MVAYSCYRRFIPAMSHYIPGLSLRRIKMSKNVKCAFGIKRPQVHKLPGNAKKELRLQFLFLVRVTGVEPAAS